MENIYIAIFIAFASTTFGAILSFLLPALAQVRLAFNTGLSGTWISFSHTGDPDDGLETGEVKISVSLFGVEIRSLESPNGYSYKGRGQVLKDHQFSGRWWSIRPGAPSQGRFLLIIGPQATFMYGLYSDSEGQLIEWCLAKKDNSVTDEKALKELEKAKKKLQARMISIPRN